MRPCVRPKAQRPPKYTLAAAKRQSRAVWTLWGLSESGNQFPFFLIPLFSNTSTIFAINSQRILLDSIVLDFSSSLLDYTHLINSSSRAAKSRSVSLVGSGMGFIAEKLR